MSLPSTPTTVHSDRNPVNAHAIGIVKFVSFIEVVGSNTGLVVQELTELIHDRVETLSKNFVCFHDLIDVKD